MSGYLLDVNVLIALLDQAHVNHDAAIVSHKQLTDVYLLGLAVGRSGALVTFDRSIPRAAVKGADDSRLILLR